MYNLVYVRCIGTVLYSTGAPEPWCITFSMCSVWIQYSTGALETLEYDLVYVQCIDTVILEPWNPWNMTLFMYSVWVLCWSPITLNYNLVYVQCIGTVLELAP